MLYLTEPLIRAALALNADLELVLKEALYMRILLIGNGFDRAHNLPTLYSDLLGICKEIMENQVRTHFPPTQNARFEDFCKVVTDEEYDKFRKLVVSNCWITHFLDVMDSLGPKWIDFEAEIQSVIQSINKAKEKATSERFAMERTTRLTNEVKRKCSSSKTTFKSAFSCLKNELDSLTQAMQLYFCSYVSRLPVEKKNLFIQNQFDKLLSFNYTMTYSENYIEYVPEEFECCYIHGVADYGDLVLGYDDHYLEEGKAILDSVPFEKYYQRIVKRTHNNYLKWIYDIENFDGEDEESELYIFGHSLAASDGDILRMFLECKKIRTHIYYRDEMDRAEKVANLAIVLGPEKLIKLAGGMEKWIDFLPIEED